MKQTILLVITTCILGVFSMNANAQTFSKMPEKQRNRVLIKMAREFYRKPKFKSWYKDFRDNGKATVSTFNANPTKSRLTEFHDVGELQYVVKLYTKSKGIGGSREFPATSVYISDLLGKAYYICLADNTVFTIWDGNWEE